MASTPTGRPSRLPRARDLEEHSERILFVDDEPGVRRAFARSLGSRGFTVDVAASAADAIELTQREHYAVVVTDLRMPGMDGFALVERLRTPLPATAFVIVTGLPGLDLKRSAREHDDVTAIIAKPWDEDEMVSTLHAAIQDHKTRVQSPSDTGPERMPILLVEDDECDAEIVMTLLEDETHDRVRHAETLGEALDLIREESYSIILSDLSLPDSRGLTTVMRLHAAAPQTAIIVLSGLNDEALALEAVGHGAQDYLVKGEANAAMLVRALRYARERKKVEQQLTQLAHFDQLTGLANRTMLRERMSHALARAKRLDTRFAIMFLDLDRFKAINDSFGHDAGDALLQEVAFRIQQSVREYDTVARLGGDEFAVLLDSFDDDDTPIVAAERILASLAAPIQVRADMISATCSIGIAVFPDVARTAEDLLKCADTAMYEAKASGRNNAQTFCPSRQLQALPSRRLQNDLAGALARDEFILHYQPLFDATSQEVVSLEALIRWQRGDTLVPPNQFIPWLEESGMIKVVGEWVLQEACSQLARWQASGAPALRVAVNLSARQFEDGAVLSIVEQALNTAGLAAHSLELELTESTLMRDTTRTNNLLCSLKELGVGLAIDDFGTGYSSLAYLRRFAVDTLKIDRSFVNNLATREDDASIVSAIIALGHRLGLGVVAEGVETAEQLEILRSEGCDIVQGYYLGRPTAIWAPDIEPAKSNSAA